MEGEGKWGNHNPHTCTLKNLSINRKVFKSDYLSFRNRMKLIF